MVTASCPSRQTLLQYSTGMLSDEQSDDLAGHLDSCPDCQATIMTLEDAEDTLIRRLRMPLASESCLAEPEFQAALAEAVAKPAAGPAQEASASDGNLAPAMPPTLGEYQVLEELGHGGMGRVYKALHTKLDRVVTLKVLPRGRVEDRQAIARFEREMRAVGQLAHPNIVQAYDAREIDGTPVLIMEFVDGLDLAEIVRRIGPLPVAEACELVRQTALGLQRAHEHGLVHRDIKPSNIMLTGMRGEGLGARGENLVPRPSSLTPQPSSLAPPQVKLLDLGLARFYAEASAGEEMTGTGQAMGTADYMAPEQASDSRSVDIRADIYSLGCTLYKLLSGRAPFGGPEYRGTLDKMNAHVHEAAPPIRQFAPDVPEELAAILDRMLAKDPNDRFATPAEVAAVLEPFCAGANLVDLAARASATPRSPLSLGEAVKARDEQVESSPLSLRERVGAKQSESSPLSLRERVRVRADEAQAASAAPIPRRSTIKSLLIGLGFLGAIAAAFAAGVLITINKNGEKYQVVVPKDSHTVVDDSGNVIVDIAGQPKAAIGAVVPDEKAIQGTWEIVSSTFSLVNKLPYEKEIPAEQVLKTAKVVITADTLKIVGPHVTVFAFQYRLNAVAKTKMIDLQTPGPTFGMVSYGVYELEGERLTICTSGPRSLGDTNALPDARVLRPLELWAEFGSGKELLVLRRVADAAVTEDEKAIQGTWRVEGGGDESRFLGAGFNDRIRFSRHGMRCLPRGEAAVVGGMGMTPHGWQYAYALDPTAKPKRIDIATIIFPGVQPLHGVYELVGDRLTICWGAQPVGPEGGGGGGFGAFLPPSRVAAGPNVEMDVLKRVTEGSDKGPSRQNASEKPATQPAGTPAVSLAAELRQTLQGPTFRTATVTRGDIVATVSATGTIEPEEVVDVSAKVAGQIVSFGEDPRGATDPRYKGKSIDFNSPVEADTVLARIDDAIYRARVEQEQAGLARARAELTVAQTKREPTDVARATILAAQAAVAQSEAALRQAQINLSSTVITSPIKGVIIVRRVNVGQNVGPDPNAPGLFLIAKDLTKLQVWASVNEADIGRIHEGTEARFTVDGFPKEVFKGKVAQIRRNAQMTQNVVLYTVVVTFDNADMRLRPYMTANLQFDSASARNVLRVPNIALRWKPRPDLVAPYAREAAQTAEVRGSYARVWAKDKDGEHVRPVAVQFGVSDGSVTEVSGPEVKEGMEVIVGEGPEGSAILSDATRLFAPGVPKGKEPNAAARSKQPASAAQTPATPPSIGVSPAAELKALQGQWKVVVVRVEKGKDAASSWAAICQFGSAIDPGKMVHRFDFNFNELSNREQLQICLNPAWLASPGSEATLVYRIDPTASPKTIDLVHDAGAAGERLAAVGIYAIEGDRLRICLASYSPSVASDQRPRSFSIRPGSGDILFDLERHRLSEDEKTIRGHWRVAAQVEDGKPVPDENLRNRRWWFPDLWGRVRITDRAAGGEQVYLGYGQYLVDAAKQPKTMKIITYHYDDQRKESEEREFLGIYKLDGDRLSIAYRQGGPPPEKFESLPGSGVTLLDLRKSQPSESKTSARPSDTTPAGQKTPASGKTGSDNPPKDLNAPDGVVYRFLDAVRKGDDRQSAAMLSELARKGFNERRVPPVPPPSGTARFEIGRVENPGKDLARVAAKWTDLDHQRQETSQEMSWFLRKEAETWRIVGMQTSVFAGEPPLILDFEKPAEVLKTLDEVRREIVRRQQQPAAEPKPPAKQAAEKAPAAKAQPDKDSPARR